jgi:hypothetical protein
VAKFALKKTVTVFFGRFQKKLSSTSYAFSKKTKRKKQKTKRTFSASGAFFRIGARLAQRPESGFSNFARSFWRAVKRERYADREPFEKRYLRFLLPRESLHHAWPCGQSALFFCFGIFGAFGFA